MKGNFPKYVYVVITLTAIAVLIAGSAFNLPVAVTAIGAGLFAYGVNRLVGEWRVKNNPDYARNIEIATSDERLAYIADKSRSLTLIITIILLTIIGIILLSFGMKPYGYVCLYVNCGISVLYLIVHQVISRRY